jgi:hypothetical protein
MTRFRQVTRFFRAGRAWLLVLLLPALLAPRGWAMRVCFCETMGAGAGVDCCRPEPERACCGEERPSEGLAPQDCAECRMLDVDNDGLQVTSAPTLPALGTVTFVEWSLPLIPHRHLRDVVSAGRGSAPPGAAGVVPLRI